MAPGDADGREERAKIVLVTRRRPGRAPVHARRRERNRRRRRRARTRIWAGAGVLAGALVLVVAAGALALRPAGDALGGCTLESLKPVELGQNSFVFAADGSSLGAIPSAENRQPLALRQISSWLVRATVAVEDRRFWRHDGIDVEGIVRAGFANVASGEIVQGGSTLTQQLARTLYIDDASVSIARKLEEMCLALALEERWPKRRILASYLNTVFYGARAYGAQAAAQTYFSKHASQLSLTEAAMIAGLPQAPSVYDPRSNPRAALARRNEVLAAMRGAGYIDRPSYEHARGRPLGLQPGRRYLRIREPFFFSHVRRQLDEEYGRKLVRAGGLRVRTTLDAALQRAATAALAEALPSPDDPAAALVSIDPRTGEIRAMTAVAPGRPRLQFNLATQGRRQAGSAFKPVALAAAIEQGLSPDVISHGPSEIELDDPRCRTNGEPWRVENYGGEDAGAISIREATARSTNTVYAQIAVVYGPDVIAAMGDRLGIDSPLEPVCSVVLGSQPVSPLELTSVYATLAAGGVHRRPQAVRTVRTPDGRVLRRLDSRGERVLHADHADAVTSVLQGVVEHGTGTAAAIGRPVAGKTGTTEDHRDAWFCGYVPQLATCVWIGHPHAEIPLRNVEGWAEVTGGSLPAEIWRRYMTEALADEPVLPLAG